VTLTGPVPADITHAWPPSRRRWQAPRCRAPQPVPHCSALGRACPSTPVTGAPARQGWQY
jgi:hypothetical protein